MTAKTSRSSVALARLERAMPAGVARLLAVLHDHRARAVVVGGVVRDAFLGRPFGDWDVATDAKPQRVIGLFERVAKTGERHGTVMVLTADGPVEVTTFRGEGPYLDGRRPSTVVFHGDLEADLGRRDFTINAMAADLWPHQLVDPFGGQGDLDAGLVRCVGDPSERFSEDGLRVLRAIRFVAVLGFRLEAGTEAAIPGALRTLAQVAWERRRDELMRLLANGRGLAAVVALLERTGVLAHLVPELDRPRAMDLEKLDVLPPGRPLLRLFAWCVAAGIGVDGAAAMAERLKLARREQRWLGERVEAYGRLPAPDASAPTLRRWLAGLSDVAVGADCVQLAAILLPAQYCGLRSRLTRLLRRRPALKVADLAVRGDDLLAMGLEGQEVGRTLAALLDWVLERPSRNRREQLLARAHSLSTGQGRAPTP